MTETPSPSSEPPDFTRALLDEMFRLWVEPAIAEGGRGVTRAEVAQALVVMPPSEPPRVLINDEFQLIARVRAAQPIEAGQSVTLADISTVEDLAPHKVDPNAGWIVFARIGDEIIVAFDFRRNRQTAKLLIERALEFADAATTSLDKGHLGPAIENGFAAAELAVKAEMYLMDDAPTTNHRRRVAWWEEWVRLGNAPAEPAPILERLYNERGASRYGDSPITLSQDEVRRAIEDVSTIIDHATARSSERPFGR